MSNRRWCLIAGGLLGALGVVLGALGAHGFDLTTSERYSYSVAVRYQLIHAVLLVALGAGRWVEGVTTWLPITFITGTVLFSGSIYGLLFFEWSTILAPLTPIGGVLMILAWVILVIEAIRIVF
jgi:uncharacterized membrane protein YgdD (TMEM256/DUF423 family)